MRFYPKGPIKPRYFVRLTCPKCFMEFWVPSGLYQKVMRNRLTLIYCPMGHEYVRETVPDYKFDEFDFELDILVMEPEPAQRQSLGELKDARSNGAVEPATAKDHIRRGPDWNRAAKRKGGTP